MMMLRNVRVVGWTNVNIWKYVGLKLKKPNIGCSHGKTFNFEGKKCMKIIEIIILKTSLCLMKWFLSDFFYQSIICYKNLAI
jgi:hypothetical protein